MIGEKEHVVVVGFGWVGQANAIALKRMGYPVAFFDPGESPQHYKEQYGTDYQSIQRLSSVSEWEDQKPWYLIAVGDRVNFETGAQDVSLIQKALESVTFAKGRVILRSTVLPQNLPLLQFDLYVPEFLHEKFAVPECETPYFFIVGSSSVIDLPSFLSKWQDRAERSYIGTPVEASYIKYLSNLWNAAKIAFVNEFGSAIGNPETKEGRDRINSVIDTVMQGEQYLRFGGAFGGHCLPKDTRAFLTAHGGHAALPLISGIWEGNELHRKRSEAITAAPLPVWFSKWEYTKESKPFVARLENYVRNASVTRPVLPLLRKIRRGVEHALPNRSLSRTRSIWNKRGKQNVLYYMHTKTRSGAEVTEDEFLETGSADVTKYVLSDTLLKSLLGEYSKHTLLEIGSGAARMTRYLAPHFARVSGIDIAPVMVEESKVRLASMKHVDFKVSDGRTIPYADGSFSFVFSYLVLQHVPTYKDLEKNIQEIARVLKKGGIAKIQLRTGNGVPRWRWSYGVPVAPEKARAFAEKSGFKVHRTEVEDIKNLWLTLEKL